MQQKKRPRKRNNNKDPSWRPSDSDEEDDSDSEVDDEVLEKKKNGSDTTTLTSTTMTMTTTRPKREVRSTNNNNNANANGAAPSAKRRKTTKQGDLQPSPPPPQLEVAVANKDEVDGASKALPPPQTETLAAAADQQPRRASSSTPSVFSSFLMRVFDKLKWLYYEPGHGGRGGEQVVEKSSNNNNNDNPFRGDSFSWKDLLLQEPLSSGTFGDVFRGSLRGREVAVKVLKSSDHSDFAKEVHFLSKLQHPNVVKYYGACKEPYKMIIMEFIPRGSLHSVIHGEKLMLRDDLPLLCSMAIDILRGLQFLHSQQIIHRDIKPGNLLVDSSNTIKITDFGISRELESSTIEAMTGFVGTVAYMAPELMTYGSSTNNALQQQIKYDYRVDIYSFGVVLWEMLTSKIPFAGMSAISIGLNVTEKKMRPSDFDKDGFAQVGSKGDRVVQELVALMKQSWDTFPSKRPTVAQLIASFSQIKEKL